LDHVTLVVRELAKIHALSWCYKKIHKLERLSDKYPFLNPSMMDDMMEEVQLMIGTSFETALKTLSKKVGPSSELVTGLAAFQKNALDVAVKFWKSHTDKTEVDKYFRIKPYRNNNNEEQPWEVLLHGDIWVNNMLFKWENGKPASVKLVDLQIVHEGDPTGDLAYFIYTGTDADFRKKYEDTFLQRYHDQFMEVCNAFETPIEPLPNFCMAELQYKFARAKIFGLETDVVFYPIMLKEEGGSVNLEEMSPDLQAKDFFKTIADVSHEKENSLYVKRLVDLAIEMYDSWSHITSTLIFVCIKKIQ